MTARSKVLLYTVAGMTVGLMAGCGSANSTSVNTASNQPSAHTTADSNRTQINGTTTNNPETASAGSSNSSNANQDSTGTNNTASSGTANGTGNETSNSASDNSKGSQPAGQASGSNSATAGYYRGLKTVTYSTSELQGITQISKQQGITPYIPQKMGGPSGYYVPQAAKRDSNHTLRIPFEDMTFYEGPSWHDIESSLAPKKGTLSVVNGGTYVLPGGENGQWYTLVYSTGAREDMFVVREGNTWVGIMPNPAKYTIPSLVQAVAETLKSM